MHREHYIGCRALRPETALSLLYNPSFLAEIDKSIDHNFEENLASMHHQRGVPVVSTPGPTLLM